MLVLSAGAVTLGCFLLEQLLLGATSLLDLAWRGMNSELSIPEGNRVKQEHRKRYAPMFENETVDEGITKEMNMIGSQVDN